MTTSLDRSTHTATNLARLDELDDFEIADGEPDIRGWTVRTLDGREIGEVDNLIADPTARKVRYLEVKAKHDLLGTKEDENVLIPISAARLNDDDDIVTLNALPSSGLRGIPRFGRAPLTADNDRTLSDHYHRTGEHTDTEEDKLFFGTRRKGREDVNYLTLSEERLAVGKRAVQQGEVHVNKSIESKHVEQDVPTMREVVTVERRPATPGMSAKPTISAEEIRVPVMGQEVVVDTRTVPVEEVIIRKSIVRESEKVEADLKREKVDVNRTGATTKSPR